MSFALNGILSESIKFFSVDDKTRDKFFEFL